MTDMTGPVVALILLLAGAVIGLVAGLAHDENPDTPDTEVIYVPQLVPIPIPSPPKECPEFI